MACHRPQDRVGNVRDAQFLHDIGCNYFVEWLLTEGIASALEKASSSIYDFPPFFRQPSEVLSGELKSKSPLFFKPNNTFPISSESVVKKINSFPFKICTVWFYPVLIRKAKAKASDKKHLRICKSDFIQCFLHTGTA